ncbi:MAG: 50S ribosome-binding GTPase, partial [Oscillospiraceae bacterium]|jgi:small GTP-binding protein|nr:50S ribosome-binding GTPase [Oscillospiraceae bacterium]
LAKKFNSGEKKDDSPNESNIPSIQKIALIGNSESGKTTFIKRIFNGVFNREYGPTISGELISIEQTFNNQKIKFNFRDTSGIKLYHEDADLVLIFVDLSKNIDQQLTTWFGIFKEATNSKTKAMVILSRSELASKDQNIESIKYHINQSIEDDLELSGRVTLFKNPISSQSISDEEILEFENEMYRVIMPA